MLRFLLVFVVCAATTTLRAQSNPLFDELTKTGVKLAKGPAINLLAPTMADGLDAAAQRKAIESVLDEGRTFEAMTRKAVVAPFVLKISDDKASAATGGTGRRVDLWFVAYGDLKKLATNFGKRENAEPVKAKGAEEDENEDKSVEVKLDELKKRKIESLSSDKLKEQYNHARFTLFERVRLHGTARSVQSETAESQLLATVLDDRFVKDAVFPNAWQAITRDEATGKTSLGAMQPYSGAGSYMKATQMKEPEGAIFVEYHIAFDEPAGWFNGANLLRSKLPIVVQDNVRKVRRKMDLKTKSKAS